MSINAWAVDETCLNKDAIDEDGNIDWTNCHSFGIPVSDELFNSDEYELYKKLLDDVEYKVTTDRKDFIEVKEDIEWHKRDLHEDHYNELMYKIANKRFE